jgi:predicted HTH transcriptional regulator
MPYFNTNDEQGHTLTASKTRSEGQEGAILTYFRKNPTSTRTRRNIELIFGLCTQSASRALANLTADGYLVKSDKPTVKCEWSKKMVHTWRLAKREPPMQERLF